MIVKHVSHCVIDMDEDECYELLKFLEYAEYEEDNDVRKVVESLVGNIKNKMPNGGG